MKQDRLKIKMVLARFELTIADSESAVIPITP